MPRAYLSAQLQIDSDILDAVNAQVAKAPALMNTALKRVPARFKRTNRNYRQLTTEPPPPSYPLRWKSVRQRRYVMAKLRREDNLPYTRTHRFNKSYDLVMGDDGVFRLINTSPQFQFIAGDNAQPMHLDTGWQQAALYVVPIQNDLADVIVQTWYTIADPFAGARG